MTVKLTAAMVVLAVTLMVLVAVPVRADVSVDSACEGTSTVVVSDPPAETSSERERPRGEKLDISV